MKRRHAIVLTVLASSTVATLLCSTIVAQNKTDSAQKIQALLLERRDVLKQRLLVLETQLKNGLISALDIVVSARNDLLKAELALATNKQQRVELLRQRLKNFQEFEKYNKERFDAGQGSFETDVLLSQAERIQAQIDLMREEET